MTLVKYNRPERDLFSTRFNDILDEFFGRNNENYSQDTFMPSVDISENETEFHVSAELPGMEKDDISVDLENGRLTIQGERRFEEKEENENYHRIESRYGKFNRSFYLPDTVDEDNITATYKNGVLNITIGKNKEKVKKQIEIA